MAEKTGISWCDATMNFWIGCTHAGPGCDHCYAEQEDGRRHWTPQGFGVGKPRYRTSDNNWRKPLHWMRRPEKIIGTTQAAIRAPRVFTLSLGDFFDKEIGQDMRNRAWDTIRDTRPQAPSLGLEWFVVTKRVPLVEKMLPPDWCAENYRHIVLIATVCNQAEADRDIPRLIAIKANFPWLRIGLSCEPLLGRIVLYEGWLKHLDWVIVGGESGGHARPMPPWWALGLADQCRSADIPFHFKQVGSARQDWQGITGMGRDPAEWPDALRHQEFPRACAE